MDFVVSLSFFKIPYLQARTVKPPSTGKLGSDDQSTARRTGKDG